MTISVIATYATRHQTHQSFESPQPSATLTTRMVVTTRVDIGKRRIRPRYRALAAASLG